MKKLLLFILAVMILSFSACSGESVPSERQDNSASQSDINSNVSQNDFFRNYERFSRLVGYWNSPEGHFLIADMEDSHTAFLCRGMWDTEYFTGYSPIADLTASGDTGLTAIVKWDDEETEVTIDLSDMEQNSVIRVRIGQGDWMEYMYAGAIEVQAYQHYLSNMQGDADDVTVVPDADVQSDFFELYERFGRLVGYWNAAERDFAILDMEDSHTACFAYGMWETEFCTDYGRISDLTTSGEEQLTAIVTWPNDERELVIDYSGLERDGKIRMKLGNDDWKQYAYAGATFEEAQQTFSENMYGT